MRRQCGRLLLPARGHARAGAGVRRARVRGGLHPLRGARGRRRHARPLRVHAPAVREPRLRRRGGRRQVGPRRSLRRRPAAARRGRVLRRRQDGGGRRCLRLRGGARAARRGSGEVRRGGAQPVRDGSGRRPRGGGLRLPLRRLRVDGGDRRLRDEGAGAADGRGVHRALEREQPRRLRRRLERALPRLVGGRALPHRRRGLRLGRRVLGAQAHLRVRDDGGEGGRLHRPARHPHRGGGARVAAHRQPAARRLGRLLPVHHGPVLGGGWRGGDLHAGGRRVRREHHHAGRGARQAALPRQLRVHRHYRRSLEHHLRFPQPAVADEPAVAHGARGGAGDRGPARPPLLSRQHRALPRQEPHQAAGHVQPVAALRAGGGHRLQQRRMRRQELLRRLRRPRRGGGGGAARPRGHLRRARPRPLLRRLPRPAAQADPRHARA
mmetsp:Transcript_13753/g.29769  ORF Transcript_13753/g.29769 Transcript_13753/m.29769 type:complete len:438 (+) Transcript_13753:1530-2843(+)